MGDETKDDAVTGQNQIAARFRALGEEAVRRLLHERDDMLAVYIYGSVGRGDATPGSDLDLHVVLDRVTPPDSGHEAILLDGTRVEFSYHDRRMYDGAWQEWIPHPEAIESASRSEGLWELREIVILHDPDGIVAPARERAAVITSHPGVIRRRVVHSLENAERVMTVVDAALSSDDFISGFTGLFHLTGGDGNPGVVPLLVKAVIQKASLPLTTRRHFARFEEACRILRHPDWHLRGCRILGIEPGSDSEDDIHPMIAETIEAFRSVVAGSFPNRLYPFEVKALDPGLADRALEQYDDLRRFSGPEAARAFLIGSSTHLFADESRQPHPWLAAMTPAQRDLLLRSAARLARIDGLMKDALENRRAMARNLYREIVAETR